MTNNEILKADILDIIFDNRNKAYGAYELRKEYNHRLTIAVGSAFLIVGAFAFIVLRNNHVSEQTGAWIGPKDTVTVIELPIEPPPAKPEAPSQPKESIGRQLATIRATPQIEIVPDHTIIKTDVPDINDLGAKLIGDHTSDGPLPGNGNFTGNELQGTAQTTEQATIQKPFMPEESNPEYPGGIEALMRFFSKNLSTPDDLSAGEKKTVLAKFKVDVDGTISQIEIVQSGGDRYDNEVIRVFKKMPKWKPAVQNGHKVAIYFTQPVTFIGVEW